MVVANPVSCAEIVNVPTRTGIRKPPRSSVTDSNVLPVASCTAVTVTPGSTPPVESVIVPLSIAS